MPYETLISTAVLDEVSNGNGTDQSVSSSQENNFVPNKWSKNGFGQAIPRAPSNGKFTAEETLLVRQAITDYCATKQITPARLCSECDHKSDLKGAWMEISRKLPHRTVQSVYRHGLRVMHPFKRGPWSDEERHTLLDLVTRYGKKWSAIQSKLDRSADSCRDKYREMSTEYVKGWWKDNETEMLKKYVREFLKADPDADIVELGNMVEREKRTLPWSEISKKMGKRSRLSCFKKWQKLTGKHTRAGNRRASSTSSTKPGTAGETHKTPLAEVPPPPLSPQPASGNDAGADFVVTSKPKLETLQSQTPNPIEHPAPSDDPSTVPSTSNPTVPLDLSSEVPVETDPSANALSHEHILSCDHYLLSTLASSSYCRGDEVPWSTLDHPLGSLDRWNVLRSELLPIQVSENEVAEWLSKPVWEQAKILLNVKQEGDDGERDLISKEEEEQAKIAARTVEAVDLPLVGNITVKRNSSNDGTDANYDQDDVL